MPSIGLISPTKRSRSLIVEVPGVFAGSVGFYGVGALRKDVLSPATRPINTSATMVSPTGPSRRRPDFTRASFRT
jgi:hypothetical protein